ncbi:MAG: 16S rRNA (guanine(527)-N(7))-methyltransferase RsmG [Candidatus Sulfotelmatobacter sp.]
MHPTLIAELLHPFFEEANDQRPTTHDDLYQGISTYIDILLRWNARINLTAIRNPEEIVTRHFGESLFAACHLFPRVYPVPSVSAVVKDFDFDPANDQRPTTNDRAAERVADVGSGAGFPGLAIKLWAPNVALTLIESNHKKATFLREVARALTLTDIDIQNVRAEALPPSTFDVVTLRAVERLTDVLPTAANLRAPSGRLALLIASAQLEAIHSTLPHLTWDPPIHIPQSKSRLVLVSRPEPLR